MPEVGDGESTLGGVLSLGSLRKSDWVTIHLCSPPWSLYGRTVLS